MKKMQKSLMLVAAAAMAFVGCSKEEISDNAEPESGVKVTRSFTAEIASSRTTFNDAATKLKWTAGDQLGIYTDVTTDLNVDSSTYPEDATNFNFTAQIDTKATTVYAYYPYDSEQNTEYGFTSTNLPIKQNQVQAVAGTLAGNYIPMSATATLAEKTFLKFTPVASLIVFNIYDTGNKGDQVKAVTFTPAGGVKINGNRYIDMTTGNASDYPDGYYSSATVTLTTPYAVPAAKPTDKKGYIYLAVTPKDYSSGGTFTVTMTNNDTYTFTTAKAIDASNVYAPVVIPMNLEKGTYTPAKDYSGTYVVLAKQNEAYVALSSTNIINSNRLDAVSVDYDGVAASYTTTDPNLVWTVAKSGDGAYTFSCGGKYLSWPGGDNNYAKVVNDAYDLSIAESTDTDGAVNIKSVADNTRVLAKNNSSQYFAFYEGTQLKDLYLVPAEYKQVPSITLEKDLVQLEYNDEATYEIAATVTDATEVVANAYSDEAGTTESDWLIASYENGKVSFMAETNTTDALRTAYIIVMATNANGSKKAVITIMQNKQSTGGGGEVTFTFDQGTGNSSETITRTEGVITCVVSKGSGSNPYEHAKDKELRLYSKNEMTFSGATITKVEFTFATAKKLTVNEGTYDSTNHIWIGSSSNLTFVNNESSQAKIKSVKVTYE